MENWLDYQFLLMQYFIGANNQAHDEKMKTYGSDLDKKNILPKPMMVQNKNSLPENMHLSKAQDHNTVVLSNNQAQSFKCLYSK